MKIRLAGLLDWLASFLLDWSWRLNRIDVQKPGSGTSITWLRVLHPCPICKGERYVQRQGGWHPCSNCNATGIDPTHWVFQ